MDVTSSADDWEAWSTPDDFELVDLVVAQDCAVPESRESALRDWIGEPIERLKDQVAVVLEGDDVAKRIDAFSKLDSYREKASEGAYREAISRLAFEARLSDPRPAELRGASRVHVPPTIRVTTADGRVEYRNIGDDVAATRELLEIAARRLGTTVDAVAGPLPRGRPTSSSTARRVALARLVFHARNAGATLEAIGVVLRLPKQRVYDLARQSEAEVNPDFPGSVDEKPHDEPRDQIKQDHRRRALRALRQR